MIKISANKTSNDLAQEVQDLCGENIFACYQCGTCTSGCPVVQSMDLDPHVVMRYLMYGMDEVLASKSIWLCVSCFMCAERCPRDIDIARVMESLRQIKLRKNVDHANLSHMPAQELENIPQIAIVSLLRKATS